MATALTLPVEKVSGVEPQVIPGLPGLWRPGEFYAVDVIGLDEDAMRKLIDDGNLPLEIVSAPSDAVVHSFFAPRVNHVPSGYMDTEATRLAEANADTPPAVVTDTGAVVVPPTPAPETAVDWAQDARARATALSNGESLETTDSRMSPHVSGQEMGGGGLIAPGSTLSAEELAAREELRAEVEGLKVPDLDDRYGEFEGYPSDGRKDDKVAWALVHEGLEEAEA